MFNFDLESFIASRLYPIPISMPSKAPAGGFSQAGWYAKAPSADEIRAVWETYGSFANGIALVCGHGLELLDIDTNKDPVGRIADTFRDTLMAEFPEIFEKLVSETSISGGTHYWYRVSQDRPNTKLARIVYSESDKWALDTDQKFGTVIETRGAGGYGIIAPTPGYVLKNSEFSMIKELTEDERNILWDIARSFNTYVQEVNYISNEAAVGQSKPGDDFNSKISVPDFAGMFEEAGWRVTSTRGDTIYLNRPGAKHLRRTDGIIVQSKKLFVSYSSSVSGFESERGYSPYRSLAILKYSGNFKAAAKALKDQGYGDQVAYTPAVVTDEPNQILAKYSKYKFNIKARPAMEYNLFAVSSRSTPYSSPEMYGLAFKGALIPVVGKQKSRKTTVLTSVIAAALSEREVCGFIYKEERPILWLDTEQPEFYFWLTQWRICVQSGGVSDRLYSYMLRDMDTTARRKAIDELIAAIDPAIVVIDGVADLIKSVNNEDECKEFVDGWLMPIATQGRTVFAVLHLNKGDGQMSGWIGTVLGRKSDGTLQVEHVDDFSVDVMMRDGRGERPPAWRLCTEKGMHGILYKDKKPDYNYTIGYENETAIKEAADAPYQFDTYSTSRNDEDIPF